MSQETIKYFSKDVLSMKDDVDGAKMWGIGLKNVMLTYFEVSPNSHFPMHRHENEQITMVLEGELFFQIDKGEICVKAGEVVAVPSNASHSVYTKKKFVKAVDAWSPVREDYVTN